MTVTMDKREQDVAIVATTIEDIEAVETPQQLYALLATRVPAPGRITSLNLFCEGAHADRMLCLVDVEGISASAAAKALEGQPFAFTSVFLSISVNEKFACRVRQNGKRPEGSCSCGSGPITTKGSLLDRN